MQQRGLSLTTSLDPVGAETRRRGRSVKRFGVRLLAGLVMLGLGACTAMPVREGPRAALLPGIEKPRKRKDIKITVHERPITAWGKCLEMAARIDPLMATLSVLTFSPIHGCARVPRDRELDPGEQPWCEIAVPKNDPYTLEHELRHCEGWDHPKAVHSHDGEGHRHEHN